MLVLLIALFPPPCNRYQSGDIDPYPVTVYKQPKGEEIAGETCNKDGCRTTLWAPAKMVEQFPIARLGVAAFLLKSVYAPPNQSGFTV